MIDIALFIVGTYQASGSFWDGFWTIAQRSQDIHLAIDAFRTMAAAQLGNDAIHGLTQLDPEVISRHLEYHGLGLPQEWTLANFTDRAA